MRFIRESLPGGWRSPSERIETRALLEASAPLDVSRDELTVLVTMMSDARLDELLAAHGHPPRAPVAVAPRCMRRHADALRYCGSFF